jgi:hypothetical protein
MAVNVNVNALDETTATDDGPTDTMSGGFGAAQADATPNDPTVATRRATMRRRVARPPTV